MWHPDGRTDAFLVAKRHTPVCAGARKNCCLTIIHSFMQRSLKSSNLLSAANTAMISTVKLATHDTTRPGRNTVLLMMMSCILRRFNDICTELFVIEIIDLSWPRSFHIYFACHRRGFFGPIVDYVMWTYTIFIDSFCDRCRLSLSVVMIGRVSRA